MALTACSCQSAEHTGLQGTHAARDELHQGVLFPLQTYLHLPSGKKPQEGYLAHCRGPESTRHRFGFTEGKGTFCSRTLNLRRGRSGVSKPRVTASGRRPRSRAGKSSGARGHSEREKAAAGAAAAGAAQFVRCCGIRHEGERDARPFDYFPPLIRLSL